MISLDAALSAVVGSYDRNARHRVDKSADIARIIDSVPKVPSIGSVERSVRAGSAIVTAIAVGGLVAAVWFLLNNGKPQ
ncbi:hypothetical protein [Dactylosporangium sp. NPDC049140]|uniref:hypothetical protein n=1 Tax=Dactylosporangium sp. NPDC049140 TaxID=3155647 RepID=UPI0033F3055D